MVPPKRYWENEGNWGRQGNGAASTSASASLLRGGASASASGSGSGSRGSTAAGLQRVPARTRFPDLNGLAGGSGGDVKLDKSTRTGGNEDEDTDSDTATDSDYEDSGNIDFSGPKMVIERALASPPPPPPPPPPSHPSRTNTPTPFFALPPTDTGIQAATHNPATLFKFPQDNDGYVKVREFLFHVLTLEAWGLSSEYPQAVRATVEAWVGTGWCLRRMIEDERGGGGFQGLCPEVGRRGERIEGRVRRAVGECVRREVERLLGLSGGGSFCEVEEEEVVVVGGHGGYDDDEEEEEEEARRRSRRRGRGVKPEKWSSMSEGKTTDSSKKGEARNGRANFNNTLDRERTPDEQPESNPTPLLHTTPSLTTLKHPRALSDLLRPTRPKAPSPLSTFALPPEQEHPPLSIRFEETIAVTPPRTNLDVIPEHPALLTPQQQQQQQQPQQQQQQYDKNGNSNVNVNVNAHAHGNGHGISRPSTPLGIFRAGIKEAKLSQSLLRRIKSAKELRFGRGEGKRGDGNEGEGEGERVGIVTNNKTATTTTTTLASPPPTSTTTATTTTTMHHGEVKVLPPDTRCRSPPSLQVGNKYAAWGDRLPAPPSLFSATAAAGRKNGSSLSAAKPHHGSNSGSGSGGGGSKEHKRNPSPAPQPQPQHETHSSSRPGANKPCGTGPTSSNNTTSSILHAATPPASIDAARTARTARVSASASASASPEKKKKKKNKEEEEGEENNNNNNNNNNRCVISTAAAGAGEKHRRGTTTTTRLGRIFGRACKDFKRDRW
ncbi:hypothetical protein K504DRAFT_463373 [Pleomassaria siparia CBS 279.74]|uniref:Uncharacterized protein n=1 Tax=Pleomassaria siparia CBS 279.74 TaxID=1314801 RepID=A0A6G1JTR6_9PLEO|nr:hypothetical protein K504DRAFT_463373 [Pleomassaria siparia CBS 279.74]